MVESVERHDAEFRAALKKHRPSMFLRGQAIRTRSWKVKRGRFVFKSTTVYMYALLSACLDVHTMQRFFANFREYKGVAFLIPFLLVYIFVSLPLMWAQIFLGYYAKVGILNLSRLAPVSSGLGYTMLILTFLQVVSMGRLCSFALVHVYFATYSKIPWDDCSFITDGQACVVEGGNNITEINCCSGELDALGNCPKTNYKPIPHAAVLWNRMNFYDSQFSVEKGLGEFQFTIFSGIVITSLITFFILQRRIVILNKILVPVVRCVYMAGVLIAFCIFFSAQDPTLQGIKFYFQINFVAFTHKDLWLDCMEKALENLHLIFGTAVTFSSLAPDHLNTLTTTILVGVAKMTITILFTFFYSRVGGIVSAMLQVSNTCVLGADWSSFYSFASVVFRPWQAPQVWNIGFYLIVYLVDLLYMVLLMFALVEAILEAYPRFQEFYTYFVVGLCVLVFSLEMPLCFKASGNINHNLSQIVVLCVGVMSLTVHAAVVMWMYGVVRLSDDIHFFTGKTPTKFWTASWYITPGALSIVLVSRAIQKLGSMNDAGSTILLPYYLALSIFVFCPIPILAVYKCVTYSRGKHFLRVFLPLAVWGPADKGDRRLRHHFNPLRIVRFQMDAPLKHYPEGLLNWRQLKLENDRLEAHRKIFLDYIRIKQEELAVVDPPDDGNKLSENVQE